MNDFNERLAAGAHELGLSLDRDQIRDFVAFKDILTEWNEKMNLTAVTDDAGFLVKHFLDSLSVAAYVPDQARLIDVGTGAGFPGVPLMLAGKCIDVTLLDSLKKRLTFLSDAMERMGKSARLVHARAEDAARLDEHRGRYDAAVSRAVAGLALLAEYCLPMLAPGGVFIAMKGPKAKQELPDALDIINKLGGEVQFVNSITLPFSELTGEEIGRTIVVVKKIRQTPPKYPRKSAELAKMYKPCRKTD